MYAATTSVALVGGDVRPVSVEAHVGRQKEAFKLSGLPDTAVREAKDRVRAAIASAGIHFPNRTITVNLAPADLPKGGTDYDLPIALGILAACGELPSMSRAVVIGELALDGAVRSTANTFGAGVLSTRSGLPCLVARDSAAQAATVPGSVVYGIGTLAEAVNLLRAGFATARAAVPDDASGQDDRLDLADVRGQQLARRALEVAAAGGHHLFLHGPPGGGKTMLARRLPGLLPPLGPEEAIEVSLLWASSGRTRALGAPPPFRAPHHTTSRAALVGGGSGIPRPGEVSLAHRGVLFLDELAEYPRGHLDTLRQPIEQGYVTVARAAGSVRFPASCQLVAASNPCACGYFEDDRRPCECRPGSRDRYRARVSGPLLDRFDLAVGVGRIDPEAYRSADAEPSDHVRKRVAVARSRQADRGELNRDARLPLPMIAESGHRLVADALRHGVVTARGADKLQRVALTIADLEESDSVGADQVAEAMVLRNEWN